MPFRKEKLKLADGHQEALVATDTYFGGFCGLSLALAGAGWAVGLVSLTGVFALVGFLLGNILVSRVSLVTSNPWPVEAARITMGGVIAPMAYVLVDGPLGPWWPGFLIMCVGGTVVFGLVTGNPRWGRLLVAYYVTLKLIAALLFLDDVDWWQWLLEAGIIAMAGLTFATIMSLLGKTLQEERERTDQLQEAKDALFAEVEVAQDIQTLLLPTEPRLLDHDVAGRMTPADEIGGDYYDVLRVGDRSFLAIGDVSGHGVAAGLTMMMARSSLIGVLEARPDISLSEAYAALNRALVRNLSRMGATLHMTFNLLEYLGDGRFQLVGQHLPVLVYRGSDGRVDEVESSGTWLGLTSDIGADWFPVAEFSLGEGDLVVLYTDGVVEKIDAQGQLFGFERLMEVIRTHASQGSKHVIEGVHEELLRFSSDAAEDDITMLVLNHHGDARAA